MKRIVSVICIVILVLGVSGCMGNRAEDAKDIALKHLNEKYDDEFVAGGYQKANWAYDYEVVTFNSKKYDEKVTTHVYAEDGNVSVKDNYFKLYLLEDACNFFKELISDKNINCHVKVRFNDVFLPDEVNATITFEEYLVLNRQKIEVFYFVDEELEDIDTDAILETFVEHNLKEKISFMQVKNIESIVSQKLDVLIDGTSTELIMSKNYEISDDLSIRNRGERFYERSGE